MLTTHRPLEEILDLSLPQLMCLMKSLDREQERMTTGMASEDKERYHDVVNAQISQSIQRRTGKQVITPKELLQVL